MGTRAAAEARGYHAVASRARRQLGRLARWPLAAGEFSFEEFAGDAGEVGEFHAAPPFTGSAFTHSTAFAPYSGHPALAHAVLADPV
jgi:hypothetical protein